MSTQKIIAPQFEVSAKVTFNEADSRPDENYYLFTYKISIRNQGTETAQLLSRHWIIRDAFGQTEEVRGAGVVGLQPKITGGQVFEYESACHLLTSNGSMKGSYQMTTSTGENFEVEIPEFYLIAPSALH